MQAAVARGAGRNRVRLIDQQERTSSTRQVAQSGVIARFRQDHAAVCQYRFGDHARDITMSELAFQCSDVVKLDHPCGLCQIHELADQCRLVARPAAVQTYVCLVDRPVVTAVHHQHFRAVGDGTRDA